MEPIHHLNRVYKMLNCKMLKIHSLSHMCMLSTEKIQRICVPISNSLKCDCMVITCIIITEARASVAPGLGLGAPSEVSHRLEDFPMEVPLAK